MLTPDIDPERAVALKRAYDLALRKVLSPSMLKIDPVSPLLPKASAQPLHTIGPGRMTVFTHARVVRKAKQRRVLRATSGRYPW